MWWKNQSVSLNRSWSFFIFLCQNYIKQLVWMNFHQVYLAIKATQKNTHTCLQPPMEIEINQLFLSNIRDVSSVERKEGKSSWSVWSSCVIILLMSVIKSLLWCSSGGLWFIFNHFNIRHHVLELITTQNWMISFI